MPMQVEEAGATEGDGRRSRSGRPGQQRCQGPNGPKGPQVRPHVWGHLPLGISVRTDRYARVPAEPPVNRAIRCLLRVSENNC